MQENKKDQKFVSQAAISISWGKNQQNKHKEIGGRTVVKIRNA